MILRVVTGGVESGRLEAVAGAYRRELVPVARQAAGLDRLLVAVRPLPDGSHEIASMTLWSDVEAAVAAYDGDLTTVMTLDRRNHGESLSRVDYYEVDDGGTRRGAGTPTRLRLTAGRVARGLDADIQQELRQHLTELPVEALEAYVGRRVLGADVEIALVTTWSAAPAGVALDEPLWPSISDRYDAFRIAVLDVLIEGSGASDGGPPRR